MYIILFLYLMTSLTSGIRFPLNAGRQGDRMVIVDSSNTRVKLACVNWYGAHMEDMVVNGLDKQHRDYISAKIAELGFNCIRLPFALDTFYENPVIKPERLSQNQDLIGMTAIEVFDATVKSLTDHGLIVILNNHNSDAGWCCNNDDGNGLWYTDKYPVQMWTECLVQLAARYVDNPLVAGFDLRNEVRPANGQAPNWGSGDKNDFALACQLAGNMVLEVNPDMLIIVEGLNYALDLSPAAEMKPRLTNPDKLIYSGHVYTFSGIPSHNYEQFKDAMYSQQTFVADAGYQYSAPYWMGETGTGVNHDKKWDYIYQFLYDTDLDWAYWSIDGYKRPGEEESYGILDENYQDVKWHISWKIEQLQSIMPAKVNHQSNFIGDWFHTLKSWKLKKFERMMPDKVKLQFNSLCNWFQDMKRWLADLIAI